MSQPPPSSPRSPGPWIVAIVFGLLGAAFFFRFLQFAYKWLRRTVDGDANFKVLACWALVYAAVCGAIAATAYFLSRADGRTPGQNGERGT
jgi:uncharacterized membrane protein